MNQQEIDELVPRIAKIRSKVGQQGFPVALRREITLVLFGLERLLAERQQMQKQRELQRKGYLSAVTWLKEQITKHAVRQDQMQEEIEALQNDLQDSQKHPCCRN